MHQPRRFGPIQAFAACAAALAILLSAAYAAAADRISLSDGRELVGEITQEIDGYIWFRYDLAGVPREEMFAPSDYISFARDEADAPGSPGLKPEARPGDRGGRGEATPRKGEPAKEKPRVSSGAPRAAVISMG